MDALGIQTLLIAVAIFLAYFAPAIVGRNKANASAIFWLNFLAGWTFVGWIVALVWALAVDQKAPQVIVNQTPTAAVLCSSCGKYSPAGASFCPLCGAAIAGSYAKAVGEGPIAN